VRAKKENAPKMEGKFQEREGRKKKGEGKGTEKRAIFHAGWGGQNT